MQDLRNSPLDLRYASKEVLKNLWIKRVQARIQALLLSLHRKAQKENQSHSESSGIRKVDERQVNLVVSKEKSSRVMARFKQSAVEGWHHKTQSFATPKPEIRHMEDDSLSTRQVSMQNLQKALPKERNSRTSLKSIFGLPHVALRRSQRHHFMPTLSWASA